jgi:hypothetical protein
MKTEVIMEKNIKLNVVVAQEVAKKIKIIYKKELAFLSGFSNLSIMPNKHSADKCCVAAWVTRALALRLKKEAIRRRMSLTELIEFLIMQATKKMN